MSGRRILGISGILKAAFLSIKRNLKLIASVLLFLLPLALLLNAPILNPAPIAPDLSTISRNRVKLLIIWLTRSCISELLTLVMVYPSIMVYPARKFGCKELVSKAGRTWKGLVVTSLWAHLMSWSFHLFILLLGISVHMKNIVALGFLFAVAVVLGLGVSTYICTASKLSLVVSVMEEGCNGVTAIKRGFSLIRGTKLRGFGLYLLVEVVMRISTFVGEKMKTNADGLQFRAMVIVTATVLNVVLTSIANVFEHQVFAVYYHECKRNQGTRGLEREAEFKFSVESHVV